MPAASSPWRWYFYPRPPRGGRRLKWPSKDDVPEFLSTPSARRATQSERVRGQSVKISIHALREEGDWWPARSPHR